ncbi:MAG: sugar transferase [Holophagaceae bacterium]|nr:sugar transferase [Holophagaceae bacterium]
MYPFFKRTLDLLAALALLLLLAPVLALAALLVRWKLGAPILFRQERAGRFGRPFDMFKFRTMTDARDNVGTLLPDEVRLTSFGRFLRATSLDELPQLFNILRGDMSLVGPRPLFVRYIPRYSGDQKRRLLVPQGITGLSQVNGRNAISWEEKLQWDIRYVDSACLILDIKILLQTALRVVQRKDISEEGKATMTEFTGNNASIGDPHRG